MTEDNRLHLVAGFLGSGKTTAIIQASKLLLAQGKRVGVVTNDQGRYLVDTAFFRLQDLPTVEVGGGCFCCNYSDLEEQLCTLKANSRPDVIFAESVGSCADLVATVIKPLLQLKGSPMEPHSFSVFADARLLRMRLLGVALPFSDEVVYIFDQQIKEANLLVINKIDLLTFAQLTEVQSLAREHFPDKVVFYQNSKDSASVQCWLDLLNQSSLEERQPVLEMDYQRYGAGEARLAWLDEDVLIGGVNGQGSAVALGVLTEILSGFATRRASIGHLKIILKGGDGGQGKISFTTLPTPGWEAQLPNLEGPTLQIMINARIEMPAPELEILVQAAMERAIQPYGARILSQTKDAFHPRMPNPTHRLE
jgi:Ni2+-binding GTPase involved in maturation of urease and hydrogenase